VLFPIVGNTGTHRAKGVPFCASSIQKNRKICCLSYLKLKGIEAKSGYSKGLQNVGRYHNTKSIRMLRAFD